jgi:D-sedoheptulose 7-phosphate isomerase
MNLEEYKKCIEEIEQDKLIMLKDLVESASDIIILGNGGSNAISSHIAEDYTKLLGKRSLCFGDSARMSCYANDYGWQNAYAKYVEHFSNENTLVILISSSGNSDNIIYSAKYCKDNNIKFIILTGHGKRNKLRTLYSRESVLEFWVNNTDYGIVESIHEIILHSII